MESVSPDCIRQMIGGLCTTNGDLVRCIERGWRTRDHLLITTCLSIASHDVCHRCGWKCTRQIFVHVSSSIIASAIDSSVIAAWCALMYECVADIPLKDPARHMVALREKVATFIEDIIGQRESAMFPTVKHLLNTLTVYATKQRWVDAARHFVDSVEAIMVAWGHRGASAESQRTAHIFLVWVVSQLLPSDHLGVTMYNLYLYQIVGHYGLIRRLIRKHVLGVRVRIWELMCECIMRLGGAITCPVLAVFLSNILFDTDCNPLGRCRKPCRLLLSNRVSSRLAVYCEAYRFCLNTFVPLKPPLSIDTIRRESDGCSDFATFVRPPPVSGPPPRALSRQVTRVPHKKKDPSRHNTRAVGVYKHRKSRVR